MSFDLNKGKIKKFTGIKLFLIDSSAFCRLEELAILTGINLLHLIKQSKKAHFFLSNEVCVELMKGPRFLDAKFILEHILNVEGSFDHSIKENKFLIDRNGETRYVVLNKISTQDYNQVLLCQNHPELTLVTNDRKLLKSASVILGKRVIGLDALIEEMIKIEHNVNAYKILKKGALKFFELKKVKWHLNLKK